MSDIETIPKVGRAAPTGSLIGLTAADAALFQAEADRKRAEADSSPDLVMAARLRAEAHGLDTLAARLLDPGACGVPELRQGQGGEITPLPDERMPLNLRDVAI